MKLKDYIHYYYGCEFIANGMRYTIDRIDRLIKGTRQNPFGREVWNDFEPHKIKLVLRRLEDMTEEEKTQIGKLVGWYEGKKIINEHHLEVAHDTMKEMAYDCLITANDNEGDRLGPAAYFSLMPYLLQQGFDLFGLIDAGLAVDGKGLNETIPGS